MQHVVCRIMQLDALNFLANAHAIGTSILYMSHRNSLIKQWQSLADGGLRRCLLKLAGLLQCGELTETATGTSVKRTLMSIDITASS